MRSPPEPVGQTTVASPRALLAIAGERPYSRAGESVFTDPSRPFAESRRVLMLRFDSFELNCDQAATASPRRSLAILARPASRPAADRAFTEPSRPLTEILRALMRQLAPSNCPQRAMASPRASLAISGS